MGLVWALLGVSACTQPPPAVSPAPPPASSAPSAPAPAPPLRQLVWREAAAQGALPLQVQQAAQEAQERGQRLLVYVGASWCEPCRYFHDAALRGELDGLLGPLTVLAYDADRDGDRLAAAGYQSKMIPLLAVPAPDGRCSGKLLQGSIKGPGAVADLVPRVRQLLGSP